MIRSLKTPGLALVAVLVLSAVVASAASAAPKMTPSPEEYPVTVKGEQQATNVLELEGGRKVECTTATFEGTIANKAEAEESKLTATPTYSGCTATILGNVDRATITMNGCLFLITETETTTGTIAAEGWEATGSAVHLICPPEHVLEIHVYSSLANHEADIPICTFHATTQTPAGDLDFKFTNKDANGFGTHGAIKLTLTGVQITKTFGTVTNCGATNQTAMFTGELKFELFNSTGDMLRGKFED